MTEEATPDTLVSETDELVTAAEDLKESIGELIEETESTDLNSILTAGYTVGIKKDGQFLLQFHGEESGIIQLYGLTKFAESQIELLKQNGMHQGTSLMNEGLGVLFKEIQDLKKHFGLVQPQPQPTEPAIVPDSGD